MKTIVVLIYSSCEIICYADVCFWIITTFEYIDKVHKISAYTRLDSNFKSSRGWPFRHLGPPRLE